MSRIVVIIVPDLMFQPRIAAAAEALRLRTVIADSPDGVIAALGGRPAGVVIDLHAAGIDADAAIRAAKDAGAAVLAFGRHTEPHTLRAARDAGADIVVPRSQLVGELPELLRRLVPAAAETPRE